MSLLSDIAGVVQPELSGIQAQAQAAGDQLTTAFEALIGLNVIISLELAFVIVILWKTRKG